MRWSVALALAILVSGCAQPDGVVANEDGARPADGDGLAPGEPGEPEQTVSPTGRPKPATQPAPSTGSESWFLHIERTCDEADPFCNCGSTRTFMDLSNSTDECDAHGGRPGAPALADAPFELVESWPADAGGSGWAAGSGLDGVLYVTTDVQSTFDYYLRLTADGQPVAESEARQGTATDAGFGLHFTAMPFEGITAQDILPGADLELELYLRWTAATSYFIGYEGDHASGFSISGP